MVKYFFLLLLSISLYGGDLLNAIKEVLGKKEFDSKKKVISIVFKDKDYKDENGRLDYLKILSTLREEGFLELKKNTSSLRVAFITYDKNLQIFLKAIKDTLFSLGFSNFSTIKAIKDANKFVWMVYLGRNYMLDPLLFVKKLREKNIYVLNLKRYSTTNWSYTLDIKNADLVPKKYPFDTIVELPKSMSAYWINLDDAKRVQIQSPLVNRWHPFVVLYNKDLKIISTFKRNSIMQELAINIPLDAKYLKIDDIYTMKNLKSGLKIYIQKRE